MLPNREQMHLPLLLPAGAPVGVCHRTAPPGRGCRLWGAERGCCSPRAAGPLAVWLGSVPIAPGAWGRCALPGRGVSGGGRVEGRWAPRAASPSLPVRAVEAAALPAALIGNNAK